MLITFDLASMITEDSVKETIVCDIEKEKDYVFVGEFI